MSVYPEQNLFEKIPEKEEKKRERIKKIWTAYESRFLETLYNQNNKEEPKNPTIKQIDKYIRTNWKTSPYIPPETKEQKEEPEKVEITGILIALLKEEISENHKKIAEKFKNTDLANKLEELKQNNPEIFKYLKTSLRERYLAIQEKIDKNYQDYCILELWVWLSPRCLECKNPKNPNYLWIDKNPKELIKILKQLWVENPENFIKCLDLTTDKAWEEIEKFLENISSKIAIISEGLLPYLSIEDLEKLGKHILLILKEHWGVWITPDINYLIKNKIKQELIKQFKTFVEYLSKITNLNLFEILQPKFETTEEAKNFFERLWFKIEIEPYWSQGKDIWILSI